MTPGHWTPHGRDWHPRTRTQYSRGSG
ncbi:MAG TPA: hypothetical protein DDY88_03040 [Actinobacteria bacterium]|nr:hypothetical protein [Actinomycetota bacterium]